MAPLTELFGFPPSGTISPSVRLLETDYSNYNPGTSFSKTALIGFSSKGPINEPVQVFNHDDLYRKFGTPDPTADHGSYLLYAAIEFLRYGSEAWILRVGCTDESDWSNFAKTAYVEVPASGHPAILRALAEDTDSLVIYQGMNDKLRFSVNNGQYKRTIVIPAETFDNGGTTYIAVPDSGGAANLVDAVNALLVDDDGIEAFAYSYGGDEFFALRTTHLYGEDSAIELISTEDAIYSTIGINTASVCAATTGSNTVWPLGSSVTGFNFSGYYEPTLKLRVNGTGDTSIDNITQTIPFTWLTTSDVNPTGVVGPIVTAADLVTYINWFVDNPTLHTYTVPGGFRARTAVGKIILYTIKKYGTDTYIPYGGLATSENLITGADALIQVKTSSVDVDEILGFDGSGDSGVSIDVSEFASETQFTAFINGTGTMTVDGVAYSISEVTKNVGVAYATATAPIKMTVWADSPGLFGNNTQFQITTNTDGTINLTIYNNGLFVESHGNLNFDYATTNNPYYIEQWINGYSDYIYVDDDTTVAGLPANNTYQLGTTTATQGSDGYPYDSEGLPDSTAIDALVNGNEFLGTGIYALSEPEKIDIDLVAAPALNSTSVIQSLFTLCGVERRDCMAIIDSPAALDSTSVLKWSNGDHPLNTTRLDSSYAALYWPWVKLRDSINGVDVWVPPTGSVLGVYANSERATYPWYAPAGLNRGKMLTVLEVETYAYLKQRDALYGNRNAVNTIVPFPNDGPTVWGQKTLQRRATALDRVNVRRLMLYLEKTVKDRARYLLFEPNDGKLRTQFTAMADSILSSVKSNRGVYGYIIKCDAELNTNDVIDRNELRARIGVQPTKAAEFIFVEFTIHRTGSFEESVV